MQDALDVLCSSDSMFKAKQQALAYLAQSLPGSPSGPHVERLVACLPQLHDWLCVQPRDMTVVMHDLVWRGATSQDLKLDRDDIHCLAAHIIPERKRHAIQLLNFVLEHTMADGYHNVIMTRLAAALLYQLTACPLHDMCARLSLLRTIIKKFPAKHEVLPFWGSLLDCLRVCVQEAVRVLIALKPYATLEQCTQMFVTALELARASPEFVLHLAGLACLYSDRVDVRCTFSSLSGVAFLLESGRPGCLEVVARFPEHRFSDAQVAACAVHFETWADLADCGLAALLLSRALSQKMKPQLLSRCLSRALALLKNNPKCPGLAVLDWQDCFLSWHATLAPQP
jgi:hypothetical protein